MPYISHYDHRGTSYSREVIALNESLTSQFPDMASVFFKYCLLLFNRTIDDIVLSYVVSILEDVGSDDDPESFDVEGFSEVMEAYIPGFGEIDK